MADIVALGQRLHAQRTARRLTLDQLAQRAGVSKAMLSQIEQDKVNPTVAIMIRIADALALDVGQLIAPQSRRGILRHIPADDPHYLFRADENCTIRTLSPLNLEKNIELYLVTLNPRAALRSEAHVAGAEEFLHVTRGRLLVTAGGDAIRLAKDDSLHYRADIPHSIENLTRSPAQAYMAVHYPPAT